jgi:hypothetical protein
MANCAYMMDSGDCKVEADKPSSGGAVVDKRRPEGDITITKAVGANAPNLFDDVFNIQYGLDQVAPIDGGPSPQLKIDGKCGPLTQKAIRDFQKKHFGWQGCDGRIDPGKQTLAKLNELRNRNVFPSLPLSLTVDNFLLAGMLQHAPYTRSCVNAAMANLTLAMNAADSDGGGLIGFDRDSRMKLVNRHFHIDEFSGLKRPVLQEIYEGYRFMLNVLDRPDAYCTLDTDDSGEKVSTVAFARLGGFFDKSDLTGKIVFRRGAYFATGIQDFAAFVFIHELKHYVETKGKGGHFGKGWYTDPTMTKLSKNDRITNCDSFAGFALEARNGDMARPGWLKSSVFR